MSEPAPEEEPIFDFKAFSIVSLEAADDDRAYWAARTPDERMQHLEHMRRINSGDLARGPFQRVFEIVDLERR